MRATIPDKIDAVPPPRGTIDHAGDRGAWVLEAVFFAVWFGCIWLGVDTRLLYHGGGEVQTFPPFRWGGEFFQEFTRYPGGFGKYLSAFLSQLFYHAWSGALILTLQAWLAYIGAVVFLRVLDAAHLWWACFVPPLLLLALHSGYTYCFNAVTNLLLGMGLACWHARSGFASPWIRAGIILVLSGLLYALAGSALVMFLVLAAVYEIHAGRWLLALPIMLLGVILPWIEGGLVFGFNPAEAFACLRPFTWKVDTIQQRDMTLVSCLYLFLPLMACGWLVWHGVLRRLFINRKFALASKKTVALPPAKTLAKKSAKARVAQHDPHIHKPRATAPESPHLLGWILGTGCALLSVIGVLYFSLDRNLKAVLAVDYYAARQMWPQVLAAARSNPQNVYVVCAVNRALYHTGRLGYKLPLFQSPVNLLLLPEDVRAHWNKIDLYLDLGCVNLALHHLSEAMAFYGERPYLLKRLVLANLVMGNVNTAKIYLRSLAHTPFHRAWARDYLRRLELDPTLAQDAEVTRLRNLKPARDQLVPLPPELMLSSLLEAHQDNRMAREYLLCYYLLAKDLPSLTKNLSRLDSVEWQQRPPLYDEAMLLIRRRQPNDTILAARPPSPETRARFEQFAELAKACGRNPLNTNARLVNEFGSGYFYYYYSPP